MSEGLVAVNPLGERNFYYPSLDGLRFFAFFLVFLHHSLLNVSSPNPLLNFFLVIIEKNGWVGVDLFFVLSGFLITTLLIKEKQHFGSFSLKNFWIRRALRIWPLYFLALIFGIFIIPPIHSFFHLEILNIDPAFYKIQLPLYFTLLGNWAVVAFGYPPFYHIAHLWTISLEEQFYLFWPLILFFTKDLRKSLLSGFGLIALALLTRFYLAHLGITHPGIYTNTLARVDTLVLGALAALFFCYKPNLLNKIKGLFNLPLQIVTLTVFSFVLHRIYVFDPTRTLDVVFGYSLIGLFMLYFCLSALNLKSAFSKFLEFHPFVYLGKISYGLYVWHILGLEIAGFLVPGFLKPTIGLLITILLGVISYKFYESRFLKLKSKFSRIISRPV